jgi:hypothetical protein
VALFINLDSKLSQAEQLKNGQKKNMRPIVSYKPTAKTVADFRQKIKEHEAQGERPDEFLPSSLPDVVSPRKNAVKPKWRATPSDENRRPEGWLGMGDSSHKKRSWKMKRVITVNLDEEQD